MRRLLAFGSCALLLTAGVAIAKPRLLASGVDSGAAPMASASAYVEEPQRGPRVEVRAWPADLMHVEVDIRCSRGAHNRSYDRDLPVAMAPTNQRIGLPMRNPEECSVSAYARYENESFGEGEAERLREGRIALKIFR